jgi:hypothetical protein
MQKCLKFFLCTFLVVILTGCIGNPLKKFNSATEKVVAVQEKKEKVEDKVAEKAIPYTFGAQYSLGKEENPSQPVTVAKNLLDSSLTITGPPSFKDSLEFKQIVDGLLATNQVIVKAAETKLVAKNQEVIGLQGQISVLEQKLGIAEKVKEKIAQENSSMANKWAFLKKIFWWSVWIAGFFILSQILSTVLPAPYGSVFGVLSFLGGLIIKGISSIIPKAKEFGGVVSSQAYNLSEKTLKELVKSIQEIRRDEELAAKIDPILLDKTNAEDSRLKIKEIKTQLGL